MTVTGIEKVGGLDAYAVVGYPEGDTPERLYFDTRTGLLVRRATILPTGVGNSPYEVDYEDYRATRRGVKVPFVLRMNPAGQRTEIPTGSTLRVQAVRDGAAIDDAACARPE